MIPAIKYALLTVKHKWFVFLAGIKTKTSLWLLITHDLSKFSFCEIFGYGKQFFGSADDPDGFDRTWHHHVKKNKHHWEHWVKVPTETREVKCLEMPERYVREMIADFLGACRAYEGKWPKNLNEWVWWRKNFAKIWIHPNTRKLCHKIIAEALPAEWPCHGNSVYRGDFLPYPWAPLPKKREKNDEILAGETIADVEPTFVGEEALQEKQPCEK